MKICHSCGRELVMQGKIGRDEICPHCRADLHCCLNCNFYDEYAQNKCREPLAEWVSDREKNNFCDYFVFQDSRTAAGKSRAQEDARAKLEALFKKK